MVGIEDTSMFFSKFRCMFILSVVTTIVILQMMQNYWRTSFNSNTCMGVKEMIFGLPQNDSRIIPYIKDVHLIPPSSLPYNLDKPYADPGAYIGQNREVQKILGEVRNGFFVEAGAHDGEYCANTLLFERRFGWTGLLIEPSPIELPNLKRKNRKAWIADVCLSPTTRVGNFEFLHRISYTIASMLGTAAMERKWPQHFRLYNTPCFPLFSILSALNVSTVDYLSLDVEGVELQVLMTIPFDLVYIKVLSVEYDMIPEGKEALKEFMESKDYDYVTEVYHDYIFGHKKLQYNKTIVS